MSEISNAHLQCSICLESVFETDCVHMCTDKTHSGMCRGCTSSYISNKIESAFLGSCPTIHCPCSHTDGRMRRTLDFRQWKTLVSEKVAKDYTLLADSLLAFLCGGCHSLKSLQITSTDEQANQAHGLVKRAIDAVGAPASFEFFLLELNQFQQGEINVEEFYNRICTVYFPGSMITATDKDVWEEFKRILRMITDPERRANLHLRHLRSRPRIWTPCCHREHCFRCKTKDFHDRKSCDENTSSLDQTVISCPSCNIAIAKGDGCNTVFCVCGKQFSWAAEKESLQKSASFLALYPEDTSDSSAQLLCECGEPSVLELAKAWQSRNNVAVSQALLKVWSKRYVNCPNQACAMLPTQAMSEGLREASNLWSQGNKRGVDQCRSMNLVALKSVFTSLFPEIERTSAALRILGVTGIFYKSQFNDYLRSDTRMVASTRLWRTDNQKLFDSEIDEWEKRTAIQFIYLYGAKYPGAASAACARFPCPMEWDTEISNSSLTFSNNNATAERAGSVSCYPAAFANLPADRSIITIVIDACPRGTNWLTFGVALRGRFKCYSSDGVGRSPGSWGISDDRSFEVARICSDGEDVATCRKFVLGDRVSAMIDTAEGWCEITINGDEVSHRFEIPLGRAEEYMFVTTFANDHKVSIVPEGGDGFQIPGQLNADHSEMLSCLKKRMRKIVCGDSSVDINSVDALSKKWVELTGSEKAARGEMVLVTPIIESIIGRVFGKWKEGDVSGEGEFVREFRTVSPEPCTPESLSNVQINFTTRVKDIRQRLKEKYELMEETATELIFSAVHSVSKPIATSTATSGTDANSDIIQLDTTSDDRGYHFPGSHVTPTSHSIEVDVVEDKIIDHLTSIMKDKEDNTEMDCKIAVVSPASSRSQSFDQVSSNNVIYNWQELIYAVCWYRVNKNVLEIAELWTLAQRFLNLHGDSAPFIAAAYCASCADTQSTFECPGEDDKKMALAFMGHFPEDMEGWYDYNASLEEPMLGLERTDKACRCIPRHFKKCPTPFDPSKLSEGDSKRARRNM